MKVQGQSVELKPDVWTNEVVREFTEHVRAAAVSFEISRVPAPAVGDFIGLITSVIPQVAPNALNEEVGPFYDTPSVMTVLGGVSKQAVDARRRKHTILALRTADDRWVYPVFQFTDSTVDPRLVPAIQALKDAPGWSTALWFVTRNPDLDNQTPLDWARGDQPEELLVASARRTAREWC